MRFEGQVAVVTGGGAGLGRAHALMLGSRGAAVVVNDLTDAAEQVADEISAAGGTAIGSVGDIAAVGAGERLCATAVERFGRLDILVNNAGFLRDRSFAKIELADFNAVLDIHLKAAVACCHAAWPMMRAQRYGRIVLTTSHAGLHGNFGQANYAAAKLALVGLGRTLSLEGASSNILVNTVAPLAASAMSAETMLAEAADRLQPAYVSAAVAYLCSRACSDSGLVIAAGGGIFARAEIVETAGVQIEQEEVSPETVAADWLRIVDLAGARPYRDAAERVRELLSEIDGE